MNRKRKNCTVRESRSCRGQHITEFAAAIVLLVFLFFIPLLDLGILPVRYFIAQELISTYARKLSHCETLSQSYQVMNADPSLETQLRQIGGVRPNGLQLRLLINQIKLPMEHCEIEKPKSIRVEWLPNGKKSPCEYILEVSAEVEISPAIILQFQPKVVGLSSPVPCLLKATSPWENLGRNPVTKSYFINE